MADTKITALTALTAADPANDVIPIVDISDTSMAASGTTKKISINNILACSPSATLASATITGAATVGTTLGVTGVSTFAAGTALLPALTTTGDTNTGIYYPAADTFAVTTGGTERYRVDSAGNCGIGVTPSAWASGAKALQISSFVHIAQQSNGSSNVGFACYESPANAFTYSTTGDSPTLYSQLNGQHKFYTAASGTTGNAITFTQAMTLDASGNLLVGTTTNGGNGVSIRPSTAAPNVVLVGSDISGGTAWQLYSTGTSSNRFYVTWGGVVNAVNTTISGISDARLKENVQDIDVGLGAILALKPRKFDWKAGKGKDIKGDRGFIAQEFEQVFPQLVDEWADPAPEGEAPYKSVRQDLIPVLVKAIQELTARVQTLEAK